jgi:hypothetical protein
LNILDPIMTNILIGAYIGVTTLLLVNIFIALLTSTFTRVHDSSKAFFVLQRAIEVINRENRPSFLDTRYKHLCELKKDFVDNHYSVTGEFKSSLSQKLDPVKDSMKDLKEEIDGLYEKLESLQIEIVIADDSITYTIESGLNLNRMSPIDGLLITSLSFFGKFFQE